MLTLENFINIIYPPVCGFCGEISKVHLCDKCARILQNEMGKVRILKNDKIHKNIDERISAFSYKGDIRKKIIDLKFNDQPYIYHSFSQILLKNEKICSFLKSYDIIVPVPMDIKGKRKRGYQVCSLIAKDLARKINGLKLEQQLLIKPKQILSQSTLNKKQRKENVKYAFKLVNKEKIYHKKVLIFDDIYTTGSTLEECGKVLKEAGASKIGTLTIAKD